MKIGEHVAFKPAFIKSISAYDLGVLRGFVTSVDGMIAGVHWVNGEGPLHVLVKNLIKTTDIYKELA